MTRTERQKIWENCSFYSCVVLKTRLVIPGRQMREHLQRMHLGEFHISEGKFLQRTESTSFLKQLFGPLKIPEPPKILEISPKKQ